VFPDSIRRFYAMQFKTHFGMKKIRQISRA
jgi:hypothetical protein